VPQHARVAKQSLQHAVRQLSSEGKEATASHLASELARFETRQPFVGRTVVERLAVPLDDVARGLGVHLVLTIFLAFEHAFGGRLRVVSEADWERAELLWTTDEGLRKADPTACLESDDVVATFQPELTGYARGLLEDTIAQQDEAVDLDDLDGVYRLALLEVIALSYAVAPPEAGEADGETTVC